MESNKQQVYLHIGNGGITFAVENSELGPCIIIEATHFGHETNHMKVWVTKEGLDKLAELFAWARKQTYKDEYVCAAHSGLSTKTVSAEGGLILDSDGGIPLD